MLRSSSWQPSMYTAPDQVACWHKAARMTDTEDIELPEREPPLAWLAGYAAGWARPP